MPADYRARGPLGCYLAARRDPISFFFDVVRHAGDFARFRILTLPFVLVNDPALIREALIDRSDVLIIKGGASAGLARLVGHGILTNRGDDWRKSRTGLQPLFQQAALESQLPGMSARIDESLERWRTRFAGGEPIPIQRELLALSFRIMCSTLFRWLPGFEDAEAFAESIRVLQLDGMSRYADGADFTPWLPTARNRRVAHAKATLERLARRAVENGAGQPMDEIRSILFAGTESVVNTLAFTLLLLDEHPEWREKAVAAAATSGPGENESATDVLTQVMSESMRLHPAGWAFERFASEDVTLGGERVAKGTRLMFSPLVLHRNRRFWRDPDRFDPSRFAAGPSQVEGVPRYGYLPFGAGPRGCIGSRFALAEMRLILVAILAKTRWRIERAPGEPAIAAEGSWKIRLSRPLRLRLEVAS